MARRSNSSITNFLQDITDDIKDFLDDEVIDRGRDTERDVRRAGRTWTDDDERGSRNGSGRNGSGRNGSGRDEDVSELYEAIQALSKKVDQLSAEKK